MNKKQRKARKKKEDLLKTAQKMHEAREKFDQMEIDRKAGRLCKFYDKIEKDFCYDHVDSEPDKSSSKRIRVYDKDGNISCILFPSKKKSHGYCYYHQKIVSGRFDHLYKYTTMGFRR